MAEETSLLQQAFTETGVQLDRIINAYERKTGPYVPTEYPIIAKFGYLNGSDIWEYCIKRFEDDSEYEGITLSGYDYDYDYGMVNGVFYTKSSAIPPGGDTSNPIFGSYDENYNITLLYPNALKVEWVDPSTIPQS